ncbi:hypothetical protein [Bosea sp. 685]|jgi:hypothetical protein|uniref:hypothetical protein n=1 Tax=Bosea sp. 685 TaxID=3080057 RepID=UPI0028931A78|nr:hypothetical protein [Bosea sp. 685]WNJ92096.1 hypothetical protein RMR04_07305 [Bosea sp. 685]
MDTLETVFETASGFAGVLAMASNELVLGLGVAFGLIIWLVTGRRDDETDTKHQPRHL